jgi:hypothetical protein
MPLIGEAAPPPLNRQAHTVPYGYEGGFFRWAAVLNEGLLYDDIMDYVRSGDILLDKYYTPPQSTNPYPLPRPKCPEGFRVFTFLKPSYQFGNVDPTGYACIRKSISPEEPLWVPGIPDEPVGASCPPGTVEYAPWARPYIMNKEAVKANPQGTGKTRDFEIDWRMCKTPAALARERPFEDAGYLYWTTVCTKPGPGCDPVTHVDLNAPPCPPGFETRDYAPRRVVVGGEVDSARFTPCFETAETKAARLAPWTKLGVTTFTKPPTPTEEIASEAELPEDIREHFVPEPVDRSQKVEIGGIQTSPMMIVLAGALIMLLMLGGGR